MDSKEAKIFKLVPGEARKAQVKLHGHKHHAHPHGHHDASQMHAETDKLCGEVSSVVKDANELLVMGPGEAKVHFKKYLEKHFAGGLFKKLVGVETVDHPTENQIVEKARGFFKAYDLFH
jgi:stalled ribosome rescue protein Dom34